MNYTANKTKHLTLTANVADRIVFAGDVRSARVEVKNRSTTAWIYFAADGTTATVEGDDTFVVGPGESLEVQLDVARNTVSVVSASAAAYTVTAS